MQRSIEAIGKKKREESDDEEDFSLPLRDKVDLDAMNRKLEKSRRSRKVLVNYFHFYIYFYQKYQLIYIFFLLF